MSSHETIDLNARMWEFLRWPERYVDASRQSDRPLQPESTERQFLTARSILAQLYGKCGETPRKGLLLADDVGLGKTTVAALVAWVVALAGNKRGVRILAPNKVMRRRWKEELERHVPLLRICAASLDAKKKAVKDRKVNLHPGTIQIVTHHYAGSGETLKCDLLIVDEAHRAKGDGTKFGKALAKWHRHADHILFLTATPFSIDITEFKRMLHLVGAKEAWPQV